MRDLIAQQVQDISEASSGAVIAVVGGLLLALWSASSGMKNLITAINRAYDEEETRGFVRLRGLSLALTMGAILFFAIAFPAIAVLPSLLATSSLGTTGRVLVGIVRFVVLFGGLLAGLAVLYRYAPDRADTPSGHGHHPGRSSPPLSRSSARSCSPSTPPTSVPTTRPTAPSAPSSS